MIPISALVPPHADAHADRGLMHALAIIAVFLVGLVIYLFLAGIVTVSINL